MNDTKEPGKFKKTLGLPSLIAVGVGIVVAQGCFVSILQGVGINASAFITAIFIAFILTLCYVFTFSELSLMMPKAGSISTYTEVAIGHFPAIVATIAGYVGPAIFAAPAELFLVEYILDILYPDTFSYIGLFLLGIIILLNILGIELFSAAQNILAFIMITALLIVGIVGISNPEAQGQSISNLLSGIALLDWNILSLTVLALWAFVGLEFICPLIEETKNPNKNVPKAMIASSIILLIVYGLVALAGYHNVPSEQLVESPVPHWLLVETIFGDAGKLIMAVLAITATCSTLNTATATVPRMLYGMASNHQLPSIFKSMHPKWSTPWFSILFVSSLTIISYIIFRNTPDAVILMMISAATAWLIAYIISHINLIVLRNKYPAFDRPYRSPWFPIPQIIGIIGMFYLLLNNSPSPEMTKNVYLNAGLLIALASIYAFFWIKLKMKKELFKGEPIESVLK